MTSETPVNIAATLRSPYALTIDTIPIAEPAPDEILIRIESIGICTSDLLVYEGTHTTNLPIIPGHESAGVVVKVGSEVSDIKRGTG
jgi:Zn-dependent alcohol dehydrogenase